MIRRPVLSLGIDPPSPLVLVIEDEPTVRLSARSLVSSICRSEAAVACTGDDALEDVRHAEFDLILLDVQMPALNGLEAAMRIRMLEQALGRTLHAPIVAYTADLDSPTLSELRRFGVNDVLEKPASLDRMRDSFRIWCRGYAG